MRTRTLFTEAVGSLPSATSWIQDGLVAMKSGSGMGWVGTFAFSTVLVRASLLPLVRLQVLESRKLAKAMPELNFLVQLLRERLNTTSGDGLSAKRREEVQNTLSVFNKGVKACLTLNDVSISRIVAPPVMNIGIFVTFVVSVREMIRMGTAPDLDTGGLLWFEDLTAIDKTMALPLLAIGTSYSALELGFSPPSSADGSGAALRKGDRVVGTVRDILQTLLLLSVPVVTQLPAGMFAYWIPSSITGMAQTLLVRKVWRPDAPPTPTSEKPGGVDAKE